MMSDDLMTAKLRHLRALSHFASDAAQRLMEACSLPYAAELNRISGAVIAMAEYRDDNAQLMAAFNALAIADQAALQRIFAQTSILQLDAQLPKDAAQELDEALTYHWQKSFGFESQAAVREELGEEIATTIEAFVHAKAEGFWKRDALAADIDKTTLSEKDMRIVAIFGAGTNMHELAGNISGFVDTELLRASLQAGALRLPAKVVARLKATVNAERRRIRPDWPPVSLGVWLA